jgi:23S rRNA (cytosine1962-C5)-methyltransferase
MNQWLLKKGEDRRLRSGHPWVFSNELMSNPRGIVPGEAVEILDNKGNFIARGYGNPHSLIAFRALTWRQDEKDTNAIGFVKRRLIDAWRYRVLCGFNSSFRLCFSEGDGLPGLIIDRYLLTTGCQVLCVQLLTAGMQKLLRMELVGLLESVAEEVFNDKISAVESKNTYVVLRNDVNIRKLEGLEVESSVLLGSSQNNDINNYPCRAPSAPSYYENPSADFHNKLAVEFSSCQILVDSPNPNNQLKFTVDLIEGQKTGFFLDQRQNIFQLIDCIERSTLFANYSKSGSPIRILDLCCYAGHWSAQIANHLRDYNVEVTLVDISADALKLSQESVKNYAKDVHCLKLDVVKELDQLKDNYYNIVIADPPAFIKAKKDIPQGSHAYLKVNSHAFRSAAYKGLVVSCSCSGLLVESEFQDVVRKSQQRASQASYRVLTCGGHSPDHPVRLSFPEGKYLKMITHLKF